MLCSRDGMCSDGAWECAGGVQELPSKEKVLPLSASGSGRLQRLAGCSRQQAALHTMFTDQEKKMLTLYLILIS